MHKVKNQWHHITSGIVNIEVAVELIVSISCHDKVRNKAHSNSSWFYRIFLFKMYYLVNFEPK